MKKEHIKSIVVLVVLLQLAIPVSAQPLTHYENNSIYMCWPLRRYAKFTSSPSDSQTRPDNRYLDGFVLQPSETCTIYGVATAVNNSTRISPYSYNATTWHDDCDIDLYIYKADLGDTVIHPVKHMVLEIRAPKYPDRVLELTPSLDSIPLRVHLHEFFFDEPITITGPFLMGLSSDKFYLKIATPVTEPWTDGIRAAVRNDDTVLRYPGGTYQVKLTPGMCQGIYPILVPQGSIVGIDTVRINTNLGLVPNPAQGQVKVEADCAIRGVDLVDLMGHNCLSRTFSGKGQSVTLDVGSLPRGYYTVRVNTLHGILIGKLLLE